MDLCEDMDSQTITACLELPGIKPADVEIQLHDDKLIVSGKRSAPQLSGPSATYSVQELKYGAFQRSINLPVGIQVGCFPSLTHNNSEQFTHLFFLSNIKCLHQCQMAFLSFRGLGIRKDCHLLGSWAMAILS